MLRSLTGKAWECYIGSTLQEWEFKMDKKLFRSLLLLITFTICLMFVIVKFDALWGILERTLGIFTPLFIGLAIAFVLDRPCAFFKRLFDKPLAKGRAANLSLPLAVTCSYLAFFAVVTAIVSFVIPQLISSFELFAANFSIYVATAQTWINDLVVRLNLESLDLSSLNDIFKNMLSSTLDAVTNVAGQVFTFTSSLVSVVVTAALAFVFSIYMLAGKATLLSQARRALRAYVPENIYHGTLDVVRLTADTFAKFVSGQAIEAIILGSLCCVGMLILKLPYAPLIGMIIGVSALIPIVGAYVGATLAALLLAMVEPINALIFVVFLVALQQIEGNVIYPKVVGTSIGLPGIWVLTAVTVGGGLFGFLGMLLSVPVASILFTLLRRDVHKRLGKDETA